MKLSYIDIVKKCCIQKNVSTSHNLSVFLFINRLQQSHRFIWGALIVKTGLIGVEMFCWKDSGQNPYFICLNIIFLTRKLLFLPSDSLCLVVMFRLWFMEDGDLFYLGSCCKKTNFEWMTSKWWILIIFVSFKLLAFLKPLLVFPCP